MLEAPTKNKMVERAQVSKIDRRKRRQNPKGEKNARRSKKSRGKTITDVHSMAEG